MTPGKPAPGCSIDTPGCHTRCRHIIRGFTLIETLIVTVLMAMAASVTIVSLSNADRSARVMAIVGSIKDLDARGRLLAQTSGASTALELDDQRLMLRASHKDTSPEIISAIDMPAGCSLQLATHQPVRRIIFDRLGHSPDYSVALNSEHSQHRWTIYGLTGEFHEEVTP